MEDNAFWYNEKEMIMDELQLKHEEGLKSLMKQIREFDKNNLTTELRNELNELYESINEALLVNLSDVENQKQIVYSYKITLQSIKNKAVQNE